MKNKQIIKKVVIVGGGTAGWLTASLLVKVLGNVLDICLIESDAIGTVGVGEATIPPMYNFNAALGLNEREFLNATQATIKLGIQFENWGKLGDSYMHAFGSIGKNFPFCDFQHFWLKSKTYGNVDNFWHYSLNYQAAKHNKFAQLNQIEGTNLPGISYAYQFDAGLYAKFLRNYCEPKGVTRIEGTINQVTQDHSTGFIDSVTLANGTVIDGDLFVDCTGLSALLIEKTLNTGFEDWSHWLPCDRAVAVPSESVSPIAPYTRSIAHDFGWQWQIPLQHRTGNGLVYCSKYMTDEQAKALLLENLDSKALAEPRVIPFRTGRRRQQWHNNVVAIGLSSGFLEPLESTSIHLIQTAATRLVKFFPHNGIKQQEIAEFNRQAQVELEHIRDFIILHYKLNQRDDSPFWRACQRMDIPESLARKMALFAQSGKVFREQDDLFTEIAWQQVMLGQGLIPGDYHPLVDSLTQEQITELMANLKTLINRTVKQMPSHETFLTQS